jgi:hypothetical protein
MTTVFNKLEEAGIPPEKENSQILDTSSSELIDRVRCCAQELQEEWKMQLQTGEEVEINLA